VAVILACIGVAVIAYGDSGSSEESNETGIGSRLMGNLITLVGSIAFGFYEVYYQTHGALPSASITQEAKAAVDRPVASRRASRRLLLQKNDDQGNSATGLYELPRGQETVDEEEDIASPKLALADAEALDRPIYLNEDGSLDVQTFLGHANTSTPPA
jgi:hypothetical protein